MRVERAGENGITAVPDRFIDGAMLKAGGEFVKVYLLLLRYAGDPSLSLSFLADRLNLTEKDVRRALRFWEEQHCLKLSCSADGEAESLMLFPCGDAPEEAAVPAVPEKKIAAEPARRRSYQPSELSALKAEHDDFSMFITAAEQYLGRPMSARDTDLFAYLYEGLGFSGDVLEFLVEYCVEIGHTNLAYMEKVALNWHKDGCRTLKEVKAAARSFEEVNAMEAAVKKAFGISGRILGTAEREAVDRWARQYKMPPELAEEACSRSLKATGKVSFGYADKILKDWDGQDIHTAEKLKSLLPKRPAKPAAGKFNFEQRTTDYDAILREEDNVCR